MTLKLYFMKSLKGKFNSVSFPLQFKKHRSSRPEVFCKKDVFSQVCNSITKDTLALLFSYEFWESFENTFSYRKPPVAASDSNNFSLKLFSCKVFKVVYLSFSINLQRLSK